MFFYLSKFFWGVTAPSAFLLLLACFVIVLMMSGRFAKFGRKLAFVFIAVALCLVVLPVGDWLLYPWEKAYLKASLPDKADGIVVLGGAVDPFQETPSGQVSLNSAAERVTMLPKLIKTYPHVKVLYSGGSGIVRKQDKKEADAAVDLFKMWNLPPDHLYYERQSRNTFENAVMSKQMMQPQPGDTWLLVTSAAHMRRSKAIFDAQGWRVIPYAVDFRAERDPDLLCFCVNENLNKIEVLTHEVIGYIAYKLTGKIK